MIINVRTLQGLQKEVDVAVGETVEQLKKKVQEAFPELESSKQKIIYGGKILEDMVVVTNTLREKDAVIVMMNRQPAFKNTPAEETEEAKNKKGSTEVPAIVTTAATPQTVTACETTARSLVPGSGVDTAVTTSDTTLTDAIPASRDTANVTESISGNTEHVAAESVMLTRDSLLATINSFCSMGFEREQVERAMRAAYNNPSRAIDYLTNGFVENYAETRNENSVLSEHAEDYEEDEGYEEAIQQAENTEEALRNITRTVTLPSNMLNLATDEHTRQLLNNPNFISFLRNVAVGSPQRISDVLELIGRTDPELFNYIRDNQEQITYIMQQIMNSHMTGVDGFNSSDESFTQENYEDMTDQLADALIDQRFATDNSEQREEALHTPATISLTEKEIESINKLEALGFPKHAALEAFIACDKNEELAANYLFENMEDEGAS